MANDKGCKLLRQLGGLPRSGHRAHLEVILNKGKIKATHLTSKHGLLLKSLYMPARLYDM